MPLPMTLKSTPTPPLPPLAINLSETGLTAFILSLPPRSLYQMVGWFWRVKSGWMPSSTKPSPCRRPSARTFTLDITRGQMLSVTYLAWLASNWTTIHNQLLLGKHNPKTGVKYQIEFSTDNSPFVPIYTSGELTTTSFIPTTSLPAARFTGHVRARDINRQWGAWSDVWDIIIDLNPPAAPVL
jgi:hypothetical protein